MNLLLDTHVVLWWLAGERIADAAAAAIAAPDNAVYVSAASIWEMSIKRAIGKLDIDGDVVAALAGDFEPLPVGFAHADLAGRLPRHHRDPFDRMLVAQATVEQLVLATRDTRLAGYGVPILQA